MGKEGTPYKGTRYYVLDLDEFIRIFYEATEESTKESEKQKESS